MRPTWSHLVVLFLIGSMSQVRPATADPSTATASTSAPPVPGADRRITLNVPKGDIRDALRLVAEQGGLNISIGPGVEGEVSVFLTDATLEGALKSIAVDNGYAYKVENGIISVSKPPESKNGEATPPLEVRIFTLRCQDAERVRDALEFALTKFGKMKVLNENSVNEYATTRLGQLAGDLEGSNSSVNSGNSLTNAGQNQNGGAGPSGTTVSTAGAPRNARRLVVTDVAENVRRIGDLIADLDQMPPQVLIETRIVEMSTDLQRQLGIDWDVNALANGPVLNHSLPLDWEAGFASGSALPRTPSGAARTSAGLSLGTVDLSQVTAMLQIHETDNAIRLLANPRLLVFNNHSASILVGERYPILTANITDFGTVTESFDTYIPVGVQLEVTPTIMVDGRISLLVHPQTSALGDDVTGTTGLKIARIRTRELSTRVVMSDGQTIALGGLISDRNTRQVSKVPGLGDLWGFSAIFRQERPRSERVDLLCFLTAHCEGADQMTDRDREIYGMYEPQFKQIQKSQEVQLHFEVPSEYEAPKPMYGDPPSEETMDGESDTPATQHQSGMNTRKSDRATRDTAAPRPAPASPRSEPSFNDADSPADAPLSIEKTRFDLMRDHTVRERRAMRPTSQDDSNKEGSLARERILSARERAGLKGRGENDRRDENTFKRTSNDPRRPGGRSPGRANKSHRFGVDSHGRPVTLSPNDEE